MTIKIFVYGTLKPGEINYQHYCAGVAIAATRAYTWGKLYNLPIGYPAMTLGNSKVEGFLLTFADPAILDRLDELEDYDPMRSPLENEYHRQKIMVYKTSGESIGEAWSYVMTFEKVRQLRGVFLPSGCWSGT